MSYEEQQSDELDALQAIYPTEFTCMFFVVCF